MLYCQAGEATKKLLGVGSLCLDGLDEEESSPLNYSAIFPAAKLSEEARKHLTIIKRAGKWVR